MIEIIHRRAGKRVLLQGMVTEGTEYSFKERGTKGDLEHKNIISPI